MRFICLLMVCVLLLPGCGVHRYYVKDEKALGTTRRSPSLNHLAVYYPGGIALNSPGYLIGIEDALPERITRPGDLLFSGPNGNGNTIEYLKNQLREGKLPFISHIIRYSGKQYGEGDCALYNYYRDHDGELVPFCSLAKNIEVNRKDNNYKGAYKNSWLALDVLKTQLTQDLAGENYSHIVVLMMGMDTPQEMAVRDSNTIIWSIRRAAGPEFRPLVIVISWPSFYDSRWLDPIWETLAYPAKADEADKLGLTWVGALMHDVIGPLHGKIHTVAITHSFGARAMTMATCVGPEIIRDKSYKRNGDQILDQLVGFAPAFSLHRFLRAPYLMESIHYPDTCSKGGRMILTSSNRDTASKMPIWVDLAGNYDDYRKFCRKKLDISRTCLTADDRGQIKETYSRDDRFLYIDTTDLMKYYVPNTQGGAHSDIFRSQVGHLVWDVIH
jgi:hypothetical protein